jgi:conjugal transfer/entry exclusion protein
MSQNNPSNYAKAIQYQLASIVSPIPVYANFNRNFATEPTFITWQLRNVHQPVYTGPQQVKGIDTPVFQMSIFSQNMVTAFDVSNTILQALHGYQGQFGGSSGFWIAKADIVWLYNTFDDSIGLHQIILDCTLDIPT